MHGHGDVPRRHRGVGGGGRAGPPPPQRAAQADERRGRDHHLAHVWNYSSGRCLASLLCGGLLCFQLQSRLWMWNWERRGAIYIGGLVAAWNAWVFLACPCVRAPAGQGRHCPLQSASKRGASPAEPLDLELPSFPNWRSHERNAAPAPHPTGDSPLRCTPAPKAAKSTPKSTRAGAAACVWYARQLPDISVTQTCNAWRVSRHAARVSFTLHAVHGSADTRIHPSVSSCKTLHFTSSSRSRTYKYSCLREHTVYRRYSSCCVEAQALLCF